MVSDLPCGAGYIGDNRQSIGKSIVDPAPFGEDTEENPFFDVDKYKGCYKPGYKDLVVACKNMLNA